VGFQNAGRAAPDSPGNGPLSSYGGVDLQANIPNEAPAQGEIVPFPHRRVRPRQPRIYVQIVATRDREAYGRTRPLRLTESDIEQLVDFALRLEWRRA
jgi:hypothetical protein